MNDSKDTVLIVEDQRKLADTYAEVLTTEYAVKTAYSGDEALDMIDESVDVVLLDRKMPGLAGRDVLERLRAEGFDCPVAMLTAVIPDWDALDIGFDDYVNKPVDVPELHRLVERLLVFDAIDEEVRSYIAQSVKQATLEGEKEPSELDDHDDFEALAEDTMEVGADLGDITAELTARETELVIETITRNLHSSSEDIDEDPAP